MTTMKMLAAYALMWVLPALIVMLLPWVVRKVRGTRSEPRITEANFLVKMRLHNQHGGKPVHVPPHASWRRQGYLVRWGTRTASWHKFFERLPLLGLAVAHTGRYRNFQTTRQPPEEGGGARRGARGS